MRAVLDTHVLMSGLLWRGTPHALLEQVRNNTLTLISSPALLMELSVVLERPKFDAILIRSNTSRVQTLAIAAQVDWVISGDDDLLCLGSFEGIPVLTPAQALQRVLESR